MKHPISMYRTIVYIHKSFLSLQEESSVLCVIPLLCVKIGLCIILKKTSVAICKINSRSQIPKEAKTKAIHFKPEKTVRLIMCS